MKYKLNLQEFAEGEEVAAGTAEASAETATAAEGTTEPVTVNAGDTLADGQVVSPQVAAAMNKQMERHPELKKVYGQNLRRGQKGQMSTAQAPQTAGNAPGAEKTIEERWEEAKNGEFAELYGRDVKGAVQDRFKNQADSQAALKTLEPMLDVLRQRAGVESNEELVKYIMDDDSLYEEAASEAGMTTKAYKEFLQIKQERDAAQQREQDNIQQQMLYNHYQGLCKQAEDFRKQVPTFDLDKELQQNPKFAILTSPEVGIDVGTAFIALHKDEIMPQAMKYGMDRAKEQMGQTIQAQRARPAEGAMKNRGGQAADFNYDPRAMTPQERRKIYDLIHKGKITWG